MLIVRYEGTLVLLGKEGKMSYQVKKEERKDRGKIS